MLNIAWLQGIFILKMDHLKGVLCFQNVFLQYILKYYDLAQEKCLCLSTLQNKVWDSI